MTTLKKNLKKVAQKFVERTFNVVSLHRIWKSKAPQTVVRLSSEGSKREFFRHAKRDIAVHIGVLIHAEIPAKSEKWGDKPTFWGTETVKFSDFYDFCGEINKNKHYEVHKDIESDTPESGRADERQQPAGTTRQHRTHASPWIMVV